MVHDTKDRIWENSHCYSFMSSVCIVVSSLCVSVLLFTTVIRFIPLLLQFVVLSKDPKGKNIFKTDNPTQLTSSSLVQYSGQSTISSAPITTSLKVQDTGTLSGKSPTHFSHSGKSTHFNDSTVEEEKSL